MIEWIMTTFGPGEFRLSRLDIEGDGGAALDIVAEQPAGCLVSALIPAGWSGSDGVYFETDPNEKPA